jgi:hypothetical protein
MMGNDALVEAVAKRLHDITNPDEWPADTEDRGGTHWTMGHDELDREKWREHAREIVSLCRADRTT